MRLDRLYSTTSPQTESIKDKLDSGNEKSAAETVPKEVSADENFAEDAVAEEPFAEEAFAEDIAGAEDFSQEALSERTRKAYRRAWDDFQQYCEEVGKGPLPSRPAVVAAYLTRARPSAAPQKGHCSEGLAASTLEQRLAPEQDCQARPLAAEPSR